MKIVDIVKDRKLGMYVLDSTINVHTQNWREYTGTAKCAQQKMVQAAASAPAD